MISIASVAGDVAPPMLAPVPNSVGRRIERAGRLGNLAADRSTTPVTIVASWAGSGCGNTSAAALLSMRAMCLSMRKMLMLPSAQR